MQPVRDSNPCRHLERASKHVQRVFRRVVSPAPVRVLVQPELLSSTLFTGVDWHRDWQPLPTTIRGIPSGAICETASEHPLRATPDLHPAYDLIHPMRRTDREGLPECGVLSAKSRQIARTAVSTRVPSKASGALGERANANPPANHPRSTPSRRVRRSVIPRRCSCRGGRPARPPEPLRPTNRASGGRKVASPPEVQVAAGADNPAFVDQTGFGAYRISARVHPMPAAGSSRALVAPYTAAISPPGRWTAAAPRGSADAAATLRA